MKIGPPRVLMRIGPPRVLMRIGPPSGTQYVDRPCTEGNLCTQQDEWRISIFDTLSMPTEHAFAEQLVPIKAAHPSRHGSCKNFQNLHMHMQLLELAGRAHAFPDASILMVQVGGKTRRALEHTCIAFTYILHTHACVTHPACRRARAYGPLLL